MQEFFLQNLWPGLTVWVALYISDYLLTLAGARLYQSGVCEKIVFEGSYELTPYFQRDIDTLRRVSPRFLWALLVIAAVLSVVWRLATQTVPQAYAFLLGVFVLIQLAIHMRHLRNLASFRAAATDAVRGRIEYSRLTMLRQSALDLLCFAGLYLVLFAFTRSWFVLGGVFGCLAVANKHWKLAREHASSAATAAEAVAEVPVR
jgi:hypothetical protein